MKKLVLIRHAKSDWSIPGIKDIDRPLNERGYLDAHKIGAQLREKTSGKKLFISSPAIRAISTALIIAREINYLQENISIHSELYGAEVNVYEEIIFSLDNTFDTIFIFGHNPTISQVISQFTGVTFVEVPTCSVSVINFETKHWNEATKSKFTLSMQLFPKLLLL